MARARLTPLPSSLPPSDISAENRTHFYCVRHNNLFAISNYASPNKFFRDYMVLAFRRCQSYTLASFSSISQILAYFSTTHHHPVDLFHSTHEKHNIISCKSRWASAAATAALPPMLHHRAASSLNWLYGESLSYAKTRSLSSTIESNSYCCRPEHCSTAHSPLDRKREHESSEPTNNSDSHSVANTWPECVVRTSVSDAMRMYCVCVCSWVRVASLLGCHSVCPCLSVTNDTIFLRYPMRRVLFVSVILWQ